MSAKGPTKEQLEWLANFDRQCKAAEGLTLGDMMEMPLALAQARGELKDANAKIARLIEERADANIRWHQEGQRREGAERAMCDARADVETLRTALERTVEALEGSFPPGDESVGIEEFPAINLSEAWSRRLAARAALAAVPKVKR